jgi:DNA primase
MRTVFSGGQKQVNYETYTTEQVGRVIQSCGIDIHSEVDSDFLLFCPYHNNYRTPAGEISKTTGQFYCFGCQERKSLIEFVMFATKRSYFEAMRLIKSKAKDENIEDTINTLLTPKVEFKEFDNELIERLHDNAMKSSRAAQYLMGRGITKESAEKYKLGYSESQDMVTIPIASPDGIWIGFVARSIEGKVFKNTPGLPKSKTLFNLSRNKREDKVFVVESSFDAIRIEQAGGKALATLGSSISTAQQDLLKKYFRSIILVSDNDEAGKLMAKKVQSSLDGVIIGSLPDSVKDISDMNDTEIHTFIKQFDDEISYILL